MGKVRKSFHNKICVFVFFFFLCALFECSKYCSSLPFFFFFQRSMFYFFQLFFAISSIRQRFFSRFFFFLYRFSIYEKLRREAQFTCITLVAFMSQRVSTSLHPKFPISSKIVTIFYPYLNLIDYTTKLEK